MGQLEDFRASLKKRPEGNSLSSEPSSQQPTQKMVENKQTKKPMKRTSIGITGELHFELKGLCIWMKKQDLCNNPSLSDMLQEMLKVYYKKYPEAKKFVDDFCE